MKYCVTVLCTVVFTLGSLVTPVAHAALSVVDLLDNLETADASGQPSARQTVLDVMGMLLGRSPSELKKSSARLSLLATQGNFSETRQGAFAAWMTGTGAADAMSLARYAPSVVEDFADSVALVRSEAMRNDCFDFLHDVLATGMLDTRQPKMSKKNRVAVQRASARALASMTVKNKMRKSMLETMADAGTIKVSDTVAPVYALVTVPKPREVVEYWTLDMLKGGVEAAKTGRDFASGRAMFSVATCIQCHQVGGIGKTVGPDLTEVGKQFKASEILEHIMDPSLKVDDEFKSVILEMKDGKTEYFGTILEQNKKTLLIADNVLRPESAVSVQKSDIKLIDPIEMSPMPEDLMITLSKEEIWDLIAYISSGNNPKAKSFK